MRGYDLAAWEPFFSAIIAAAAALTGLLFVAVSINLDRILKGGKFLPARAAETLATLLLIVANSALTLVPQNIRLVGVEILITPCRCSRSRSGTSSASGAATPMTRCYGPSPG
jgi:modulator of FtsH protease